MKMQVITIALVLASGVAALITFMSTQQSLKQTQNLFYHEGRFADVFADLKRAPLSLEKNLNQIPGVVSLETRIAKDFLLHIPGRVESAVGHFISIPDQGETRLNRLYLRKGRLLDPKKTDEVIISEGFAEANDFKPGDPIAAIVNGRYKNFTIVGTALSPEYIYAIRGEAVIPDDRQFGIFWTSQKGLEAALDMDGSFNSLSLILGPGSSTREVMDHLDGWLIKYGGLGAYDRRDQISNRFITDELSQQKVMAIAIPLVFLSVAAFLLNIVVNRIIGMQRSQIATLKALGYRNISISFHYIKMIAGIVLLGVIIGVGVGIWLGREYTIFYTQYFRFPMMTHYLSPALILTSIGVSFLAGFFGAFTALRRVFQLQPADALRPPAPPAFHENIWESFGLTRFLSTQGKMTYRNLTLHPFRTTLGILGISFALMITMLGLFWWDTINFIILTEFSVTQREDANVVFVDHLSKNTLWELENLPGVLSVEGYRTLPVRLRSENRNVQTALTGYPKNSRMRQLVNKEMKRIPLPAEGMLLSRTLAERLQVKPGDLIRVEVLEGKQQKWTLRVAGQFDQWLGYAAYMDLSSLLNLLGDKQISTASLDVDMRHKDALQHKLKNLPKVAGVSFKRHALKMFQKTMAQFILVFATGLSLFALVIAVGVVYNSARISLSERAWELMSLRVLGFSKGEVFRILGGEIVFQILCALPLGWLLGYSFCALMIWLMETETYVLPLVIEPKTFAYASLVVLFSGLVSLLIIRRRLNQTNIVTALKIRE